MERDEYEKAEVRADGEAQRARMRTSAKAARELLQAQVDEAEKSKALREQLEQDEEELHEKFKQFTVDADEEEEKRRKSGWRTFGAAARRQGRRRRRRKLERHGSDAPDRGPIH